MLKKVTCHSNKTGRVFHVVYQFTVLNIKISELNIKLIKEAMLNRSDNICKSMNIMWLMNNTIRE